MVEMNVSRKYFNKFCVSAVWPRTLLLCRLNLPTHESSTEQVCEGTGKKSVSMKHITKLTENSSSPASSPGPDNRIIIIKGFYVRRRLEVEFSAE